MKKLLILLMLVSPLYASAQEKQQAQSFCPSKKECRSSCATCCSVCCKCCCAGMITSFVALAVPCWQQHQDFAKYDALIQEREAMWESAKIRDTLHSIVADSLPTDLKETPQTIFFVGNSKASEEQVELRKRFWRDDLKQDDEMKEKALELQKTLKQRSNDYPFFLYCNCRRIPTEWNMR